MNRIDAFQVHLDTTASPHTVTVSGTARYNSDQSAPPLEFAFTFDRVVGLESLSYMVDNPFDRAPFVPVTGRVSTGDTSVDIAAVRADAYLFWTGENPRPQVRMVMEYLPPGLQSCDVDEDYSSTFLDIEPADWSRVRSDLRRGCGRISKPIV